MSELEAKEMRMLVAEEGGMALMCSWRGVKKNIACRS